MKEFREISCTVNQVKRELESYRKLLVANPALHERKDIKPFFEKSPALCAFLGSFAAEVSWANLLAYEFEIAGDFSADIMLGRRTAQRQAFYMVELEEGCPDSIFRRAGRKSTKEWNRRFEHGFSQLVDWHCALDGQRNTPDFRKDFGQGHAMLQGGLLVIGRSAGLSADDWRRFHWRGDMVQIINHAINCVTYDELYEILNSRVDKFSGIQSASSDDPQDEE
jgi:hypothetical protein